MKRILIVEDEFIESRNLERMLLKSGYQVPGIARSVAEALHILESAVPDFVLVDIFLKGEQTGLDLAALLNQRGIPFLYLSANTHKSTFEAAKTTRPYGFLAKPFRERDVLAMLEIAMYQHEHRRSPSGSATPGGADTTPSRPDTASGIPGLVGADPQWMETAQLLRVVAPSETSVLIQGESGTGKELLAKAVHALSPRSGGPFIKVNCAALPATLIESILFGHEKGSFTGAHERSTGKFEQAEKGTLFLDEIGELPLEVQVKLLRALQEKEVERLGGKETIRVDVRIVAATNRNLEAEMAEGRFRLDLYYRLNVFPLHTTPLRERKTDIPLLARHFIEQFCRENNKSPFELPPLLLEKMLAYSWPGNTRELQNIIQRIVLLYPGQPEAYLARKLFQEPPVAATGTEAGVSGTGSLSWQEYEKQYILSVLRKCKGKISGEHGAARALDLPPSTLESKMKRLGITKADYQ